VPLQDQPRRGIDLEERHRLESGALQAEAEPPDPGEQVEHGRPHASGPPRSPASAPGSYSKARHGTIAGRAFSVHSSPSGLPMLWRQAAQVMPMP
jgi:hypothetical protein